MTFQSFQQFLEIFTQQCKKNVQKKKLQEGSVSSRDPSRVIFYIRILEMNTEPSLCGRSPWRKVCDWIRQRVPPFVIVCRRRQQLSSCGAHSPSVWLRALRTASTWLPGPSPARWAARPRARPGRTTMMGVHHTFGPATQREHGRLAEEARGTWKRLEDMFRHPEKEGTPSGVAVSCRCYAGFGAPAMRCFYRHPPRAGTDFKTWVQLCFSYMHI